MHDMSEEHDGEMTPKKARRESVIMDPSNAEHDQHSFLPQTPYPALGSATLSQDSTAHSHESVGEETQTPARAEPASPASHISNQTLTPKASSVSSRRQSEAPEMHSNESEVEELKADLGNSNTVNSKRNSIVPGFPVQQQQRQQPQRYTNNNTSSTRRDSSDFTNALNNINNSGKRSSFQRPTQAQQKQQLLNKQQQQQQQYQNNLTNGNKRHSLQVPMPLTNSGRINSDIRRNSSFSSSGLSGRQARREAQVPLQAYNTNFNSAGNRFSLPHSSRLSTTGVRPFSSLSSTIHQVIQEPKYNYFIFIYTSSNLFLFIITYSQESVNILQVLLWLVNHFQTSFLN